jgi:hypothetical protein
LQCPRAGDPESLSVPHDLAAHVFDFSSDEIEVWHVLPCEMRERALEQKENTKASRL